MSPGIPFRQQPVLAIRQGVDRVNALDTLEFGGKRLERQRPFIQFERVGIECPVAGTAKQVVLVLRQFLRVSILYQQAIEDWEIAPEAPALSVCTLTRNVTPLKRWV